MLVIGEEPLDQPFGRAARLLVAPSAVEWIAVPAEGLAVDATIPDDPALPFSDWFVQVLLLEPTAVGGISATAGLELVIGYQL
ncbi:MAG: hypothetical protein FJ293_06340 [Planctomycetes bacterium]|nr:hypothetical protein [Planctomycetota bacterium]